MKLFIPVILLSASILIFVESNRVYGPLIKDVHDKYRTSGVYIILETNRLTFERITIWHEAARMLVDEGISTCVLNFKQFENEMKVFMGNRHRTLVIMVLEKMEQVHSFESITKDLYMSYGIWLIFFTSQDVCEFCRKPDGSLSNPKFDSKVLISCCNSNMIEEWYFENNRTKRQELGRLKNENGGINWFSDEFVYARRYSLGGQALRIAAVKRSVLFWEKDGEYCGFLGEILKELSREMNFTVSKIIWEAHYGSWETEISNWTGVIGRLHRREADLGVSDFFMTIDRLNAVSYTSPVVMGNFQLYIRKDNFSHLLWNAYFKVFTTDVWGVLVGLILTTPILLTIIRYKRRYHFFPLHFEHQLFIWGIYCQQSLPEFPDDTPSRIVYTSILLSAVVTLASYSASMISSLAVSVYPSFNTLEEFVRDGTYQLVSLDASVIREIRRFSDDEIMHKLWSLIKPKKSHPESILEAFEQVCSERVAFYTHETIKKFLRDLIPCEITSIKTSVGSATVENLAMITPRKSKYLELFNHHIERFRTNGLLKKLERKYYVALQLGKSGHPPVPLQGVLPLLVMLAIGFLIAIIILIIERKSHLLPKRMTKLRNQKLRKLFKKKCGTFPAPVHNHWTTNHGWN